MKPVSLLLLFGLLLAGCAPEGESIEPATIVPAFVESVTAAAPPVVETPTNPPTAEATAPPATADPTETAAAIVATAITDAASVPPLAESAAIAYGRTDDGAFFHGAADAPVTLIDYSDFL